MAMAFGKDLLRPSVQISDLYNRKELLADGLLSRSGPFDSA